MAGPGGVTQPTGLDDGSEVEAPGARCRLPLQRLPAPCARKPRAGALWVSRSPSTQAESWGLRGPARLEDGPCPGVPEQAWPAEPACTTDIPPCRAAAGLQPRTPQPLFPSLFMTNKRDCKPWCAQSTPCKWLLVMVTLAEVTLGQERRGKGGWLGHVQRLVHPGARAGPVSTHPGVGTTLSRTRRGWTRRTWAEQRGALCARPPGPGLPSPRL